MCGISCKIDDVSYKTFNDDVQYGDVILCAISIIIYEYYKIMDDFGAEYKY